MAASVTIYTTPYCPFCIQAKALLKKKSVRFEEIDVSSRTDLRAWLLEVSNQRTVPQIFINGASIGGYSELSQLDRQGVLHGLLSADPGVSGQTLRR
jgi:glutaredoxin 3